jgi:hypothetical protein
MNETLASAGQVNLDMDRFPNEVLGRDRIIFAEHVQLKLERARDGLISYQVLEQQNVRA